MLATVVDLTALWKILVAVLLVGVGVTAIFGQGVLSAERLADARANGDTRAILRNGLVVALAALVCLAALVVGFVAMTHK